MKFFNTLYLFLLAYIIAALVWWGMSLNQQSEQLYKQEMNSLQASVDSILQRDLYQTKIKQLEERRAIRKKQYLGEGTTFLLVIFVGASVVYSAFRRSINLSKLQNNFMLSVTHELKSPIAAMKLNLQTLEKYQLDEEKKNRLISKCILESNRLNDLCNNMLFASQMEGRTYKPTKEKINFSELVNRIVHDYQQRYPGIFQYEFETDFTIFGDAMMVQLAIHNVIENALKYAPQMPIHLVLKTKLNVGILQVKDEGVGIPDEEKSQIFKKFYRIGNENTRKAKGTGLGLYLTKKIMEQHQWKIIVKDNQPKGSIFEMQFPIS